MTTRPLRNRAPLALVGLTLAGCGPPADDLPRQQVSGDVTLDGEPLTAGRIELQPTLPSQPTTADAEIGEGRFAIPAEVGPVPGRYTVIISSPREAPIADPYEDDDDPLIPEERIPRSYNAESTLIADVVEDGPNRFTFALSRAASPRTKAKSPRSRNVSISKKKGGRRR